MVSPINFSGNIIFYRNVFFEGQENFLSVLNNEFTSVFLCNNLGVMKGCE